jgi:hypothetical protein
MAKSSTPWDSMAWRKGFSRGSLDVALPGLHPGNQDFRSIPTRKSSL